MEETNKDPNFMAQADVDKKLEEKFKAANQKLEEIQKVLPIRRWVAGYCCYQIDHIACDAAVLLVTLPCLQQ